MLLNDLVKRYVPLLLLVTLLLPLGLPAGCRSSHQQSDPDDLLIGAYYYPWWNTKKWSEQEAYVHYPQLGQYVSRDQAVVEKHISWTKPSGIDFFAVSWWGSRWEYNEESAGWRDRTTTDYFTDSAASEDFKYCLLYESGGRLEKDVSGFRHPSTITDSGKTNEAILFEDFGYFTSSYFNNPCYLRVNGRPVLIISLAWEFRDWTNAFARLREATEQNGYDIFLIGIMDFWKGPDWTSVCNYDAVTCYHMFTTDPNAVTISDSRIDASDLLARINDRFQLWSQNTLCFVPNAMPGFNDTLNSNGRGNPVLPRSPEFFRQSLGTAADFLDSDVRMIMITSFNEWHEDTQVEPAEDYNSSYLDVIKELASPG